MISECTVVLHCFAIVQCTKEKEELLTAGEYSSRQMNKQKQMSIEYLDRHFWFVILAF